MKPQDAYGAAPEEFKASITSALRRIEEEKPVKKQSLRLAVCIAAALLLLAGVVYAAANDWKLFNFYNERYGIDISEEAQNAIGQNHMGQRMEVGDVIFTVQEAIADGRYLYLTVKAESKDANSAYLMGIMDSPSDWMTFDGKYEYEKENRRSYKRAALEDGKRLISAETWANVIGHEGNGGFGDSVVLSDGSLRVMIGQELPIDPGETAIEVELKAYVREWMVGEEGEEYVPGNLQDKSIRFTLPVTPPVEQVSIDVGGKLLPGTAAEIDRVWLLVTPLSCYYKIKYTVIETEDKLLAAHSRNVLWFELLDEQGEALPMGLSLSGSIASEDDVHYAQESSVRLTKLPQTLTIRPDESWGAGPDDMLVLTIPAH